MGLFWRREQDSILLIEEFFEKNKKALKIWFLVFSAEFFIFFVLAIIAGALKPTSSVWLMEFLSWIKGIPNENQVGEFKLAIFWFPFYFVFSLIKMYLAYSLLKDAKEIYKGKNSEKLFRLRKYLTWIMAGIVVSIFSLMIHGILWWIVCFLVLITKCLYIKEAKKLDLKDVKRDIFVSAKIVKKSLEKAFDRINKKDLDAEI